MRKTSDLVDEMLKEAQGAWLVVIVVGFPNETKIVSSTSRQPLEELNQLVQGGGSPIGLLKFTKEGDSIQGEYRPFEEYENAQWVPQYLASLLDNAEGIIALSQQKA
ncbi:MAG TPA: hypothetical protein VMS89_05575 [Methanoregulaceae archaeon]|nr:hypothetical protein [Methanoregulaceae archaeon]